MHPTLPFCSQPLRLPGRPGLAALAILVFFALAGCGPDPADEVVARAARIDEVERYRQQRLDDLRKPDGWLSLAGLYWLGEGPNRFGSDASNQFVFPAKAPPRIGTFMLDSGRVHLAVEPGVEVRHNGEPLAGPLALMTDAEGAPSVLELGTWTFHVIERDGRFAVRLKDRENPALAAFQGLTFYPIELAWQRPARFEPYDPPRPFPVPTIMGTVSEQTSPGAVVFEHAGATHRLDVSGAPGDSAFFVIFADATNGAETYGGGRYLWVEAPTADGTMQIDFNKAYNPPCVFTPYATCPLPPPQNRLPVRVEAGEKHYQKPEQP